MGMSNEKNVKWDDVKLEKCQMGYTPQHQIPLKDIYLIYY